MNTCTRPRQWPSQDSPTASVRSTVRVIPTLDLEQVDEARLVLVADLRQCADLHQALQREVAERRQGEQLQQDVEEVGVEDVAQRDPREVHLGESG